MLPSIDIASKIANIPDVSLDYHTGKDNVQIDKNTSERILEVSRFRKKETAIPFPLSLTLLLQKKDSTYFVKPDIKFKT